MSTAEADSARGFSLVEVIVAIVVLSVAAVGVTLVYTSTARGSAEALINKQALAVAEAMLEEIQLAAFSNPAGGFAGPGAGQNDRQNYDDVSDYHGFATTGYYKIDTPSGTPDLAGYNVAVTVAATAFTEGPVAGDDIGAADSKLITVTVTHPASGLSVILAGYKINYP
jgi:MSHA pilin protein MshD